MPSKGCFEHRKEQRVLHHRSRSMTAHSDSVWWGKSVTVSEYRSIRWSFVYEDYFWDQKTVTVAGVSLKGVTVSGRACIVFLRILFFFIFSNQTCKKKAQWAKINIASCQICTVCPWIVDPSRTQNGLNDSNIRSCCLSFCCEKSLAAKRLRWTLLMNNRR